MWHSVPAGTAVAKFTAVTDAPGMSFARWMLLVAYFLILIPLPWQYGFGVYFLWLAISTHMEKHEQHMRDIDAMMRVRRVAASRGKDIE